MRWKLFRAFVLLTALGGLLYSLPDPHAHAQTAIGVSIGVGDTMARIDGQTSPDAFVTIKDDDQVVGTVVADAAGNFSKLFIAQTPGIHYLTVFPKLPDGMAGDSTVVSANFREHETTNVFVFLPTTITLAGDDIAPGTQFSVSGQTYPAGDISIYIDQDIPRTMTADAAGNWAMQSEPGILHAGNHSIVAVVSDASSHQSTPTAPRFFTIRADVIGLAPPQQGASPTSPSLAAPGQPAISVPKDNTVSAVDEITFVGISDAFAQIEVWRNNRLMASVFADEHGGWYVPVKLQSGLNEISTRACRAAVCGKFSSIIHVTYNPAEVPLRPLRAILDNYRFSLKAGERVQLGITTQNGSEPFEYDIDWADGTTQLVKSADRNTSFSHVYNSAGRFGGKITVRDTTGAVVENYFSASVEGGADTSGARATLTAVASLAVVATAVVVVTQTQLAAALGGKVVSVLHWIRGK